MADRFVSKAHQRIEQLFSELDEALSDPRADEGGLAPTPPAVEPARPAERKKPPQKPAAPIPAEPKSKESRARPKSTHTERTNGKSADKIHLVDAEQPAESTHLGDLDREGAETPRPADIEHPSVNFTERAVIDQIPAKAVFEEGYDLPEDQLSPIAWDSLRLGKPVVKGGTEGQPAILAYSRPLGEMPSGQDADQKHPADKTKRQKETQSSSPSLLLEVVDENPNRRWSEDELLLIAQVTDQLTLALENAQLFEQTQHARDALQVSVRYQKSVAEAVAILTERGFSAISEVLQLLGEAAQVSRAYYIEIQIDHRGPYWRVISEWRAPGVSSQLTNTGLRQLSSEWLKPWMERLTREGYLVEGYNQASPEGREFLQALGAQSVLQFPVAGQHETPGCILFEQVNYERSWTGDEIAALQTAASAMANTIVRETLFNQLQVNLSETEAQYQASAQLNSASNAEEILAILRQFTILGHINAMNVTIELFDRPWNRSQKPEWLTPVASWSPTKEALPAKYANQSIPWKSIETLISPDHPTIVFDLANDPRINATTQSAIRAIAGFHQAETQPNEISTADRYPSGAKSGLVSPLISLLNVPLNVSGRWIGQIIALYGQTTGFTEREIRRLVSLSGQAAVAVESLRLLEETRQRNEELMAMNQVTGAVSRTLEINQVLGEILQRVLAVTEYDGGLITYLNPDTNRLTLAVQHDLPLEMVKRLNEVGLEGSPCDLVFQCGETVYAPDIINLPEDVLKLGAALPQSWPHADQADGETDQPAGYRRVIQAFTAPLSLGFKSYLGVPLSAKGEQLGTVCVFSSQPKTVMPSRIALTEAIGQQVGVAVDNARLFQSTQIALGETEALYQASSELNAVQSYEDILGSLRRFTILGKSDKLLSIALFNHPWFVREGARQTGRLPSTTEMQKPEWVNPIAQWSSLASDVHLERYEFDQFPAMELLSPTKLTIIEDVAKDTLLDEAARQLFAKIFEARSVIFSPLFMGSTWIGIVFAAFSIPLKLDETQIRRLAALSGQAAIAIQNLRLLEESRRRANQLQTAAEIARDTSSTLALDSLLKSAVGLIVERFGYYHASIFLIDEAGEEAVVRESTGLAGEEMKRSGHRLTVGGRSLIGQVTHTCKPLVLNDVHSEEGRSIHQPNPLLPFTQSELGIPLAIGTRVIGALDVQSDVANSFSEDDISVLQTLSNQIAVAVDNARSYELVQEAADNIREADRLKTQFLANMSHELRTPLNSIIGFSRVILKGIDGPINEQQAQDLNAIYSSGQHLLGLINDVLDVSRIEAGKMDLAFEKDINLGDIIRSVMSTTVGLVKDKPIELKTILDPDLPLITGDAMKIRQILINLLSNAAKFTDKGTITVSAAAYKGENDEPQVIIQVIDTGPGISLKDQAKLFQPFSQVDGSLTRKTGGSGLGLSICSHLVQMHHGKIGLNSEIGQGSTFFFTLPVEQSEWESEFTLEETKIQPEEAASPAGNSEDQKRVKNVHEQADKEHPADKNHPTEQKSKPEESKHPAARGLDLNEFDTKPRDPTIQPEGPRLILAIEKDHQVIDLYKRYLAGSGYTVISLTRLEQAVTVARGIQPFAITLDIAMTGGDRNVGTGPLDPEVMAELKKGAKDADQNHPAEKNPPIEALSTQPGNRLLDGFKVLQDLKTDPGTRHIPVVVCTMTNQRERAFQIGASDYLLKPILEQDLNQAIQRLQQKSARRQGSILQTQARQD